MAQDIVSDGLNQIMNAKRVGKTEVRITRVSKVLISLFDMMKKDGYLDYSIEGDKKKVAVVEIFKLNVCKAIKPRYYIDGNRIEKYLRRFLVSRNFGVLVVSTNQGLMNQDDIEEKKIGGSLIAYYY